MSASRVTVPPKTAYENFCDYDRRVHKKRKELIKSITKFVSKLMDSLRENSVTCALVNYIGKKKESHSKEIADEKSASRGEGSTGETSKIPLRRKIALFKGNCLKVLDKSTVELGDTTFASSFAIQVSGLATAFNSCKLPENTSSDIASLKKNLQKTKEALDLYMQAIKIFTSFEKIHNALDGLLDNNRMETFTEKLKKVRFNIPRTVNNFLKNADAFFEKTKPKQR